MYINPLFSGSSGNCSVIEQDGRFLLVDMGGSCKATRPCASSRATPDSSTVGFKPSLRAEMAAMRTGTPSARAACASSKGR